MKNRKYLYIIIALLIGVGLFLVNRNFWIKNISENAIPGSTSSEGVMDPEIPTSPWMGLKDGVKDKNDFLSMEIDKDFKILDEDLVGYIDIINSDFASYQKNLPKETEVYKIIRSYVYGEKFPWLNKDLLFSCLDGKTTPDKLTGDDALICVWENKYVSENDNHVNYYHIKDTLTKFKGIVHWAGTPPCEYFIEHDYDYGTSANPESIKITDYLVCNKLKNKDYDIKRNYYLLQKAFDIKKCDYLDDNWLKTLCGMLKPKNQ